MAPPGPLLDSFLSINLLDFFLQDITVAGCDKSQNQIEFAVTFQLCALFTTKITLKNFMGSYYGSVDVRSDFHRLLKLWKAGQLDLEGMITKRMKIDEINDAFDAMKRGEVIRTVITF